MSQIDKKNNNSCVRINDALINKHYMAREPKRAHRWKQTEKLNEIDIRC